MRHLKLIILIALPVLFFSLPVLAHQVVETRPALAEAAEGGLSSFHYLAQYKLETALPGIAEVPAGSELPSYIKYLFVFGLGIIGITALIVMMYGGIQYVLAAGNVGKTTDAKDAIYQALIGMGLLLVSYLLLRTINPDLVNLRNPSLMPSEFKGTQMSEILGGKDVTLDEIKKAKEGDILYKSGKDVLWVADKDTVINCETTVGGETICGPIKISDLEKMQNK